MIRFVFRVCSLFIFSSAASYGNNFYVELHNTGNEKIYYSVASRGLALVGWRDWQVEGWGVLNPGQRVDAFHATMDKQVCFAFSKRGGYVVYRTGNRGTYVDGWHTSPDAFSYKFSQKSVARGSVTNYVKASFGYRFEVWNPLDNDMFVQKVKVPSYKSDEVVPFDRDIDQSNDEGNAPSDREVQTLTIMDYMAKRQQGEEYTPLHFPGDLNRQESNSAESPIYNKKDAFWLDNIMFIVAGFAFLILLIFGIKRKRASGKSLN